MRFCIKLDNEIIEILKSYGIRDRAGLVPRKVPVKGKNGYFMRTVWVRPELVENPYKHKLEEHPEEYREDLPKLLDELSNFNFDGKDEKTVFEMTRKMGKANNMAIKGNHLRLNEEERIINEKIYNVKRLFCENLAEYYVKNKLNCKWLKVEEEKNFDGNVLYVRDSATGIQISFHGYNNEKGVDIDVTNDPKIWDGILNSFEYTEKEYKEARKQKENVEKFKKEFVNYASGFYKNKLHSTIQKILKSKRVDKMLQDDIKEGSIKSKEELEISVSLSMPDSFYKDEEIYINNFMDDIKRASISIKVSKKDSYKYLRGADNIKKLIFAELEKLSLSPKKIFTENFDEMEKGFILGEIS